MTRRTYKATSSKATWDAVDAMSRPLQVAKLTMLAAIVVAVVFQPKVSDPSTYWAGTLVAALLLVAGVFLVKGGLRLGQVVKSGREDKKRIAAGLPVEAEDPEERQQDP